MLALAEYRGQLCENCRGWLPDTTAAGVDATDFTVHPPLLCHQCEAITITANAVANREKVSHLFRWRATWKRGRRGSN